MGEGTEAGTAAESESSLIGAAGDIVPAATLEHLASLEDGTAMDWIERANGELSRVKLRTAEYLSKVVLPLEGRLASEGLGDTRSPLRKAWHAALALVGRPAPLDEIPVEAQIECLLAAFQGYLAGLDGIRQRLAERRSETGCHIDTMRQVVRDAIPHLKKADAEASALAAAGGDPETAFLEARAEFRQATYAYNLAENVLETLRVYRNNLDVLNEEAEALGTDISFAVGAVKCSYGAALRRSWEDGGAEYKNKASAHKAALQEQLGKVIPEMQMALDEAEAYRARMDTCEEQLSAEGEMDVEERFTIREEYDVLRGQWLDARAALRASTYMERVLEHHLSALDDALEAADETTAEREAREDLPGCCFSSYSVLRSTLDHPLVPAEQREEEDSRE